MTGARENVVGSAVHEPLRILQVLRAPVGGLFRHVQDLTEALTERGHQVGVVVDALAQDSLSRTRLEQLETSASLGVYRVAMPRTVGPADLRAMLTVNRLARRLGVQIVHGHGAKGGLYARLACLRLGRSACYTPHGGVLHFTPSSANGRLYRAVEIALLPSTDTIFFESEFARDAFTQQFREPRCPAPVVHNGLREAEFEEVETATEPDDFVFIGELRQLKGVHVLLEALTEVRDHTGRASTLSVVGDGPDRQALQARTETLGLTDRVRFHGAKPARGLLGQGRTLVLPSLAESFPYIVLEAIAAGRPVIATQVGGVAEMMTGADLVTGGDVPGLRAALQRALDHPAALAEAARTQRAFVRERFSLEQMVTQIESQYRLIRAQRGPTR